MLNIGVLFSCLYRWRFYSLSNKSKAIDTNNKGLFYFQSTANDCRFVISFLLWENNGESI